MNATKAGVGWSFIPSLLLCQQRPVNLERIKSALLLFLKRVVVVLTAAIPGTIV